MRSADMTMKHVIMLLLAALVALQPVAAAELKVELPKLNFVLQSVDYPLLQREGQVLPSENEAIQKLSPLLNEGKTDQVLTVLRERFKDVTSALEAGDPKGDLRQRVVVGGAFSPSKQGAISAAFVFFVGEVYQQQKNNAAAELAYKAALAAIPDYTRVHESLGILYLLTERYKEALPRLSRAVQLGLATPNLYGALGFANYKLENYFGAASAFQNALMLDAGNDQWERGLLASLYSSKQQEQGLALVDQLLKNRSNESDLWVYRSSLQLDAGRRQQALSSLEVALRLGNDDLANLQVAAVLQLEFGGVDRAVTLLRAGIGKGLEFRYVDQIMQSLMAREQWAQLQRLLDEYKTVSGLSDTQQSRLLLRRAALSQHNNDAAASKTQLQQAVTLDPGNAEALLLLGQLQHKDKNYAQAELLLQRATAYPLVAEAASLTLAQVAIDQHDYRKALKLLRDAHAVYPNRTDLAHNIETLESLTQLSGNN